MHSFNALHENGSTHCCWSSFNGDVTQSLRLHVPSQKIRKHVFRQTMGLWFSFTSLSGGENV